MRRENSDREPAIVAVKQLISADLEKDLGKDETPSSNLGLGFLPPVLPVINYRTLLDGRSLVSFQQ